MLIWWPYKETTVETQNSNVKVLTLYLMFIMDDKFQQPQEVLNWEPLTYNVVALSTQ